MLEDVFLEIGWRREGVDVFYGGLEIFLCIYTLGLVRLFLGEKGRFCFILDKVSFLFF